MYSGKKKSKQVSQVPLSEADQMPDEDADDTLMEDLLVSHCERIDERATTVTTVDNVLVGWRIFCR